ncbi:MAG: MtrB/PioB family decaheme-associated outer membrane protein, partial [Gammaproteobacteria bacterium]|nr:MtrB/PioB family decaheme-associated outer membrane protein [Gammaproteobacteria bacterium]
LDASLVPTNIESERRIYEIGARYLPTTNFVVSANYRQQQQDGNRIFGGSYFTQSSLMPGRFDYTTDLMDLGVGYAFDRGYVSLDYHLSDFDSAGNYLQWESPFTTAAGAETALLSRPPTSSFQQVSVSGNYRFAAYDTVLSYSAATGKIEQDGAFLDYTSNANLDPGPLPLANLGAEVDTTNFALSLTSRPFDKARVRFSYRFDERDNGAPQETWTRVITDTFISTETATNRPYSFERTAIKLSGDYDLFDDLRLSAGYEYRTIDRDFQEVAEQTEDTGWGRLRWKPSGLVEITARGGASRRDIDRYDEAYAGSLDQNPLMRKYNLAYRYRWFGELTVAASLPETPVGLTFTSLYADDSYTQSLLGLTDGTDLRLAADLGWTVTENSMLYLNVGWEDIESNQAGSEQFATPDWTAAINDQFVTTAVGLRINNIAEKIDLRLDYTMSDGETEIGLATMANGPSAFPALESDLDYLRLRLDWRYSDRLEFNMNLRYQQFATEDWALAGVAPATLPTVLSLGAAPYDEDSWFLGIGVRYLMGGRTKGTAPPETE